MPSTLPHSSRPMVEPSPSSKSWGPTERDIVAAKKKAEKKLLADKSPEKAKADETAAVTPTPSIEEAGKKAEVKQKGRVQKTDFKPEADKPAPVVSVDLKPATTKEAVFLKRLHTGSCGLFATVLGPEANEAHRDHFHLDMKVRRSQPRRVPLKSRRRPANAAGPRAPLTTRRPDGVPKAHGTSCRLPRHADEPAERPDVRSHCRRAGARRLPVFPARRRGALVGVRAVRVCRPDRLARRLPRAHLGAAVDARPHARSDRRQAARRRRADDAGARQHHHRLVDLGGDHHPRARDPRLRACASSWPSST